MNHYYQPLIANYHYLAIVTSSRSLFLIFGNFEPVLHWSRWVFISVISGRSVQPRSFCSGSSTAIANRYIICQRLNFRTFEPVIHPSRWVEAVVKASNPGIFGSGSATSDNRCQVSVLAVEFQDLWAGLTLNSLSGRREAASFICCKRWIPSKELELDLFGSSLRGWSIWISGRLSRSNIEVAECGSV